MLRHFALSALLCWVGCADSFAQLKSTASEVSFFSEAPLENISARSTDAVGVLRLESGEFAFSLPIRSFRFARGLMEQHFNDHYLESDRYPTASFVGRFEQLPSGPGTHTVKAIGRLTIHGVTREVQISGTATRSSQGLLLKAVFPIRLTDHKVSIPRAMFQNIAEVVQVTTRFDFDLSR